MPDFHYNEQTTVRRKGGLDKVGFVGCGRDTGVLWWEGDGQSRYNLHYGDRRSRQIAQRHWVVKTDNLWSSGGGHDHESIKKTTQGKEVFLRMKEW